MKKLVLLISTFVLTIAASQIDLTEFVEVREETWHRNNLGITLSYPYDWVTAPSPIGEAQLYLQAPSRLPSLMVSVRPAAPDVSLEKFAQIVIASVTKDAEILRSVASELDGAAAHEITFKWIYPQGDRLYLHSTVIATVANDRLYVLLGSDSSVDEMDEGLKKAMASVKFNL